MTTANNKMKTFALAYDVTPNRATVLAVNDSVEVLRTMANDPMDQSPLAIIEVSADTATGDRAWYDRVIMRA